DMFAAAAIIDPGSGTAVVAPSDCSAAAVSGRSAAVAGKECRISRGIAQAIALNRLIGCHCADGRSGGVFDLEGGRGAAGVIAGILGREGDQDMFAAAAV